VGHSIKQIELFADGVSDCSEPPISETTPGPGVMICTVQRGACPLDVFEQLCSNLIVMCGLHQFADARHTAGCR
jgi:hypothetical protein